MSCNGTSKDRDTCNCEKIGCEGCYHNQQENSSETKKIELFGNLYDINKNLVAQNEIKLSEGILNSKKQIITDFIKKQNNYYYMLLCNERKDYTVFHWHNICNNDNAKEIAKILVDECLFNRGEIRGIDLTKNKDAIEIWLMIDEEAFIYYFFPYDMGVIEVGE